MLTVRRFVATLSLVMISVSIAAAQEEKTIALQPTTPTVTAAATTDGMRFAALTEATAMRLEIYSAGGEQVFDSGFRKGALLDWSLKDGKDGTAILPDGAYVCVVTYRDVQSRLRQKRGALLIESGRPALRRLSAEQLTPAQAQALATRRTAQSIAMADADEALTILPAEAAAITITTHDGEDGRVVSTQGGLSFRTGDFFAGQDKERIRITEDGRVGIGTDHPQAMFDVAGAIRARGGIVFNDGTALTSTGRAGRVNGFGEVVPNAAGTGTQNFITKWTETGGAGTLGDSALFESGGKVGINTNGPAHPLTVRQNGGTAGVHTFGELFVDRDNRTRSASLIVGTGGTFKWIFGMPFQSDGFQVYDLTNNVSRFFVDPTNGNIGIGTTTPKALLSVSGAGAFNAPGAARFDLFNIAANRGVFQHVLDDGTWQIAATDSLQLIAIDSDGNVSIGSPVRPVKLDVRGSVNTSKQYRIGDNRVLSIEGSRNTFAGVNAGSGDPFTSSSNNAFFGTEAGNHNIGNGNSFFGSAAGSSNLDGTDNSFFGRSAGSSNSRGGANSFFGVVAGLSNQGNSNVFIGAYAGRNNGDGNGNTFVGAQAGESNMMGSNNTLIGQLADLGSANLTYATALGSGAVASDSNSVVLGRANGQDTVRIPGNLIVTGTVAKGGGSFKIDHPLDPLNKTLSHSFVESPDMMNIYNGNVTLDARGRATVMLPAYFEALNREFRYQLTALGAPGPNLYIAAEIKGNQFKIAGGRPRMRVSWQVTGIRHDAFANANRIPVEEDKPAPERGTYLHPGVFGQPESKGVKRAAESELPRRTKVIRARRPPAVRR